MTFSVDFLTEVRLTEVEAIRTRLPPGQRVLELGAGTGAQARALHDAGLDVVAIDIPGSIYEKDRLFPMLNYDGARLPFKSESFDAVVSSSVLEHVRDRGRLQEEILRVLRAGGTCIHILPTGCWRFWTSVAHYCEILRETLTLSVAVGDAASRLGAFPLRHGEEGTALTELWSFSRYRWEQEFRDAGFDIVESVPMRLFYTGHMVLKGRLSLAWRRRLAYWLGSACRLYRLTPRTLQGSRPATRKV